MERARISAAPDNAAQMDENGVRVGTDVAIGTAGIRIGEAFRFDANGASFEPSKSVISGNILILGYVWGFFSKDRRTWHDRIAGTQAVRATG